MPPGKDVNLAAQFTTMIVGGVLGMGFYIFLIRVAYRSPVRMAVAAVGCLLMIGLLEIFTRRRIRRKLPAPGGLA